MAYWSVIGHMDIKSVKQLTVGTNITLIIKKYTKIKLKKK